MSVRGTDFARPLIRATKPLTILNAMLRDGKSWASATAERRSHGSQTGRVERRLKAVSRRRRERDSARLEPAIDAADTLAITATLDLQDSRSRAAPHHSRRACDLVAECSAQKDPPHLDPD